MPRTAKTSTSEDSLRDVLEEFSGSMLERILQMNEKLMTGFNHKLSACITKLTENMTTLVQNMTLQVTKSFSDCLTAILTALLMKLETSNNANVASANVDTAAKSGNQSTIGLREGEEWHCAEIDQCHCHRTKPRCKGLYNVHRVLWE